MIKYIYTDKESLINKMILIIYTIISIILCDLTKEWLNKLTYDSYSNKLFYILRK